MSAESRTIKVSNLSPKTTKESLSSFVGFCGSIESIDVSGTTATVVFARESAAKTAALLNGGHLDGSSLEIHTSASDKADEEHPQAEGKDVDQESKPRTAIAAELLAHGYSLSDTGLQKAIEIDSKYGISNRFLNYFKPLKESTVARGQALDQSYGVTEKATSTASNVDAKLHAKERAQQALNVGRQYYEKALSSSVGSKVFDFYTSTSRSAKDIHEEAKRIAESKKGGPVFGATSAPADGAAAEVPASAAPTAVPAVAPAADAKDAVAPTVA